MSKILFRGKRVDNGEWVYGYLIFGDYIRAVTTHECVDNCPYKEDNCTVKEYQTLDDYQVDIETVGQYTGLNDKSGTKIFDGDIVAPYYIYPTGVRSAEIDYDEQGVVSSVCGCYRLTRKNGTYNRLNSYVDMKYIEYISNYGEKYDYKNNIYNGIVLGNKYDKNALIGVKK